MKGIRKSMKLLRRRVAHDGLGDVFDKQHSHIHRIMWPKLFASLRAAVLILLLWSLFPNRRRTG